MASESSVKSYLTASDLTSEARARRRAIHIQRLCPHGVSRIARRCQPCDDADIPVAGFAAVVQPEGKP